MTGPAHAAVSLPTRPWAGVRPFLRRARTAAGGAFAPSDLAGLLQWYEAGPSYCFTDTAGTVAAGNGDAVACWKARGGYGNDLTQATAGKRPILRQDAGGKWYVDFDGSDDELDAAVSFAANPTCTWAALNLDFYSVSCPGTLYRAGDNERLGVVWFPGNTTLYTGDAAGDALYPFTNRVNGAASNTWAGEDVWGVGGQTGTQSGNTYTDFRMGYNAANTNWFNGFVAGWVTYSTTPTGADLTALETYMTGLHP